MQFLPNGKVMFDDPYEMNYHLFMNMGLSINRDQYLYDQDTMITLKYKDKYIKATVEPREIYPGRTDIVFDPAKNYNLVVTLLGYYVEKLTNSPEGDMIGYNSQYIEDNSEKTKQRFVIRTMRFGTYESQFYFNLYLAYIEALFVLTDSFQVDLSNFDVLYL